jgi:hypothetical protein
MKRGILVGVACALVLFASSVPVGAATTSGTSTIAHRGTCTVDLTGYGSVNGRGTLVSTPSGQLVFVCNIDVTTPPANTVVQTFPGTGGNVVVVTVSGRAVVVFTPST